MAGRFGPRFGTLDYLVALMYIAARRCGSSPMFRKTVKCLRGNIIAMSARLSSSVEIQRTLIPRCRFSWQAMRTSY